MIIEVKRLWGRIAGITLYPFIFVLKGYKKDVRLINHEKIHVQQQKELLVIFFYIWYLLEMLIWSVYYRDSYKGYMAISFEKEAYANDSNLEYLKTRKWYSFLKYLKIEAVKK